LYSLKHIDKIYGKLNTILYYKGDVLKHRFDCVRIAVASLGILC